MNIIQSKPVVAIYMQRYLNKSMTFVYWQLLSAMQDFDPIVITSNKIDNRNIFPFDKIFSKKITLLGRLYRLYKKLTGKFAVISPMQKKYFYNVLKKNNVALIHAHFGPSAIEILPVAERLGIPLIVTFHGYDASSLLKNKTYIKNLKGLLAYSYVITVSKYIYAKLLKLNANPGRMQILHCSIDLNRFRYVQRIPAFIKMNKNEEIVFLQISNFVEKKGHIFTIQAFGKFFKTYGKSKLILGGDGPLLKNIKALCENLKITDKVEFYGTVKPDDVFSLMRNSDIFVHHSVTTKSGDEEGIPTVIMEAMATGLPVVSTYHSGIPELIDNNVNGFLVKEGDIDEYSEAILKAIKSDENVANAARLKIEQEFENKTIGLKLSHLYKKAISEN